jgi:transposase InsO family protein
VPRYTSRSSRSAINCRCCNDPDRNGCILSSRPVALGLAVGCLERLAHGTRNRETGDGHRLASAGPPVVLDLEESPTQRATADLHRCPRSDSENGERESALGRTANSRGTPEARFRHLPGNGCKVHGATDFVAVAVVAHVPGEPRPAIAAADFFVVPTATCRLLFVLVILAHERRRVVHVAATEHPTAAWTAQQLREAVPWNEAPRYLVHDRDTAFSAWTTTAPAIGIEEILTAPRSPWQNAYAERLIGSIRRECLDHIIIISERGLRRALVAYVDYYLKSRTHLALEKDAPVPVVRK